MKVALPFVVAVARRDVLVSFADVDNTFQTTPGLPKTSVTNFENTIEQNLPKILVRNLLIRDLWDLTRTV